MIGGNGSLAGAERFSSAAESVAIVGIPAAIDNDIAETGAAIGVDPTLNTIVEACD